MKNLRSYFIFLMMVVLFAGCSSKQEEYKFYDKKTWTALDKVANTLSDILWDLQHSYYGTPFRGYWKFYNPEIKDRYEIYHFTDSLNVWINPNVLEEYNLLYWFSGFENYNFPAIAIADCGSAGPYEYQFRHDSLFLYHHYDKKRLLRYFAVRLNKDEIQQYANFSTYYVKVEPLKANDCEIFENKQQYSSFINIGKPYDKKRYGNSHRIQINDVFISCKDIQRFVFTELDKLDEGERSKLEVYLNADKDTPLTMIDSIKTVIHTAYPNLKLYRAVLQAETGKIGKIKL